MLYVGPSERRDAWQRALIAADGPLLEMLALDDEPGAALFELATYVNGMYTANALAPDLRPRIELVEPVVARVRRELGWEQRGVDLGLMRWIRRSSCLSVVVGAGATMSAGGPSWSELVRALLELALDKGHELAEDVVTEQTGEPMRVEDGQLIIPGPSSRTVERRTIGVERFAPEAEEHARRVLAAIERHGASTDVDELQGGAQLCADLWGQELFMHVTGVLYSSCAAPGPIHRAIAELAAPQEVPGRPGIQPGWDAVITYNFDDLAGEALDERELPRAVWGDVGRRDEGRPQRPGAGVGLEPADLPSPRVHPTQFSASTRTLEFVFSTHQYAERYGRDYEGVLAHVLHARTSRDPCTRRCTSAARSRTRR